MNSAPTGREIQKCGDKSAGCLICGRALVYHDKTVQKQCALCGKNTRGNAECEGGHFVCDDCHRADALAFLPYLRESAEQSPAGMFSHIFGLRSVHMHGPEHHIIVPCVLLAAYRNNGGELDLAEALEEAVFRGRQVPGGACGYLGVCGAAAGAGIYASIATGSNPLNGAVWHLPQRLVSRTLAEIPDTGGPRCCKRTSFIAVGQAIRFTREHLGVTIPEDEFDCAFSEQNKECLKGGCRFFAKG